jgi:hypothetical protein
MMSIQLDWQRPLDGVQIVPHVAAGDEGVFLAGSDRFGPVSRRCDDLEDPLALRLVNCHTPEDMTRFVSRFGFPDDRCGGEGQGYWVAFATILKDDIEQLLSATAPGASVADLGAANQLLKHTTLHPSFEFSEKHGRHILVMRARTPADLMAMEVTLAIEVGASLTHCAHCGKAYLTGPLTGRRSHSVYCSDKCRVAAMRLRNAEKGKR